MMVSSWWCSKPSGNCLSKTKNPRKKSGFEARHNGEPRMKKLLKVDPNFTPCLAQTNDALYPNGIRKRLLPGGYLLNMQSETHSPQLEVSDCKETPSLRYLPQGSSISARCNYSQRPQ
jgi:hypothetical protein